MLSRLRCAGCGTVLPDTDPYPFRCPRAGADDVDHIVVRILDANRVQFPGDEDDNPFLRYRTLLRPYHLATDAGWSDDRYRELVADADEAVAAVDGHGFRVTPFAEAAQLSRAVGCRVWAKDETGNVAGSHKGRHLMGLLLHLQVAERAGLPGADPGRPLAIASCGNAALAAGVVARAGGRRLTVFVPTDADPGIVARLSDLGSEVVVCAREPGTAGDPTYHRLQAEIGAGAIPFTCQGNENGLTIEGGETLGYELASRLRAEGTELDHLVIQVGGGALASACIQALSEAVAMGGLSRLPRIHTVQTAGAHPLQRAYDRIRADLSPAATAADRTRAVEGAARHRSAYMWPWEDEPKSVATGILDDETYDWQAVVAGMLATDGQALVVDEDLLVAANELVAQATNIPADPTGTAGLAGLLALRRDGTVRPGERVGVLLTGVRR
jgi:threonine synthase